MQGLILRTTGSFYEILGEDHKRYTGVLRGKIKLGELKVTNPIAVGDGVLFDTLEKEEGKAVIHSIVPRHNYMVRNSTHKKGHGHLIAANIDQAALVVTLMFPRTSLGFIDRFLVTTETFRIPCLIIFNKTDLYDDEAWEYNRRLAKLYEDLGYKCLYSSTWENDGIDEIKKHLKGKKTLFSGHSGVGKSSLLNAIHPDLDLYTGEVSEANEKGTHTTTFAEMFPLDEESYIIDTPGINEFGVNEVEDNELAHYFPEMRALLGQCKFNNCMHLNEPGCAVIQAVKDSKIALPRYESYKSILAHEDNRR